MPTTFKSMKTSSQTEFQKLIEKTNALNESSFRKDDERYWQPTVDKAGNGFAKIRFLPRVDAEDLPYVRYWDHGWQGPGGWYIELSRTSLKNKNGETEADPCTEYNNLRWQEGENSRGRAFVSGVEGKPGSKRRLHYVSNIYVIDDPAEPKNNGTVRLYRYGAKVFEKLQGKMNPKYPGDVAFNPFDLWTGANFQLRIKKVDKQRNYDDCVFDAPGPLHEDDKVLEQIFNQEHPLLPLIDPSNFKSYEELEKKLHRVLNLKPTKATVEEEAEILPPQPKSKPVEEIDLPWNTDDEDDDLSAFKKLAAS